MKAALPVAAAIGTATAQTTSASLPAATTVHVADGQAHYNDMPLASKHVGAAQDYQILSTTSTAAQYYFNDTANMVFSQSVVQGQGLPCFINTNDQVFTNSGPLECGATFESTYPAVGSIDSQGYWQINGVVDWYVCTVNATSYGAIANTVVGALTSDKPSGTWISDCAIIDALQFASTQPTTTSSTTADVTSTTIWDSSTSDVTSTSSWGDWSSSAAPDVTSSAVTSSSTTDSPADITSTSLLPTYTGAGTAMTADLGKLLLVAGGLAMVL